MEDRTNNWGWIVILIVLVIAPIVLFVICARNSALIQEWLCAGAMFVFAFASLVVEIFLRCQGRRSNISSAFSLLSVIISITIFLGGACFQFWWEGLSYAALVILVLGYMITVIWYLIYFYGRGTTHLGSWDILKGFGGATFAEFTGGVGILVSIGIYLVYTPEEPFIKAGFWWAAQLAALISLFSAAAWVQRYVLEKPEYPVCCQGVTQCHRFLKTGPNFLNSIAVLLTMLAVLFPTQENRSGLGAAVADSEWTIFVAWGLVLFVWGISALFPALRRGAASWPTNPRNQEWRNRDYIKPFLWVILILTIISLALVIWIGSIDASWPSELSQWAARIAAGCFVLGITWKWVVDQYQEESDSELKMLMIFRDIALLVCGTVIFYVQFVGVGDPARPLSTLYKFILGMMAYSTLIGVLIGAYKWSSRGRTQARDSSASTEMQSI